MGKKQMSKGLEMGLKKNGTVIFLYCFPKIKKYAYSILFSHCFFRGKWDGKNHYFFFWKLLKNNNYQINSNNLFFISIGFTWFGQKRNEWKRELFLSHQFLHKRNGRSIFPIGAFPTLLCFPIPFCQRKAL